ncbi:C3a anaphylatoxin chemotactic receptor-like isoform X5 [Ctenopharyngodon idella]|uniref:C3a anaphylatoxin chemotactic receptor-like isoform X3 n=1 Tax=Ctenopharyngodon idella TaxID=7959 RepID=UPI002232C39B|nr:C3a anaphylatoxin chemotactic receptor-like isoform X3 [Ctenopharyngodon idella]XP_051720161.1 C3a anaphylatoxin chemotactic receptor-like isoform X4 [Ctenopharyngodon idella]XP_051720162.1 C3a anaphylatoxin chemotactic receptor-like isoform X5 [Ctenopharyngodon idella]
MENVTNATTLQEPLSSIEIFNIFIYFVTFALGIVGNGLVIFVTGYKMKTTVNSIWFLNLAIADFIFILIIILYIVTAFNKMAWHFGDFMCKFVSFVTVLNMFASIFLLTVISLDRCLSTWVIVWAQNKRTLVKARIICALVWVLSILCSIPFVINRLEKDNQCTYNTLSIFRSLVIYRFIVGFLIPFLIIASSYIAIGVRAKRLKRGKKLKPFRVIISVIMAFFICWFPFHVQQLCTVIADENEWHDFRKVINAIGPFVNCLVHLNSCLNPILYVFMCEEFKKKLKQSLLLVLESAFAEEHLSFRLSRPSTCSGLSESQGLKKNNTTISSTNKDNKASF